MKRILVSLAVVGSLAAIPVSNALWGKGHVPAHKAQVCHKGVTITVGTTALGGHLRHGDCELPVCDFNNVFHTEDACTSNNPGGQCTGLNTPAATTSPGCVASGRF